MKAIPRSLLLPVALIGLAIPAQAAVLVSYSDTTASPTVSSTDLINGVAPTLVGAGGWGTGAQLWNQEVPTGAAGANDGLNAIGTSVGNGNSGGNATRTNPDHGGGADLIWNFATAQSFDSINLYFGWGDGGRDNVPNIKIFTSATPFTNNVADDGSISASDIGVFGTIRSVDLSVAANGGFTLLASTVETAPSSGSNIMASISSTSGPLATGVRSLYIQFGAVENGYVGLREIDVLAIPEPTTWALLAGSLTTLMVLRRRSRKA